MKRTALYEKHIQVGARMGPFAGFDMPIQYSGIIAEHNQTRNNVSLFDTCHMGECHIEGEHALPDLEKILTADIAAMESGRCRYSLMCNEKGGVLDDLLVYCMSEKHFFLVVNAGTAAADMQWISAHLSTATSLRDVSEKTAKIDLQGPESARLIQQLTDSDISNMRFFSFHQNGFKGRPLLISRTGYTGEIGFEIYSDIQTATAVWDSCIELGALPAGLGARDTLRLEMGMPLYGHELSTSHNAAEAGLERAVSSNKTFIGAECVRNPQNSPQRLYGISINGRSSARSGDSVLDTNQNVIGQITSGSLAPSLGHCIAMAYLDKEHATAGNTVFIKTKRSILEGTLTTTPFYKNATGRRKLSEFL